MIMTRKLVARSSSVQATPVKEAPSTLAAFASPHTPTSSLTSSPPPSPPPPPPPPPPLPASLLPRLLHLPPLLHLHLPPSTNTLLQRMFASVQIKHAAEDAQEEGAQPTLGHPVTAELTS